MGRTTSVDALSLDIVRCVREYTAAVEKGIRSEVDAAAADIKRDIQAASPVGRTGGYKKGWSVYKEGSNQDQIKRIIHNRTKPGLVHLLEHGHASRGGGRVAGIPHVAPAAEPRLRQMEENIKRIIRDGG